MLRSFLSIALRILTAHNFMRDQRAQIKNGGIRPELTREVNRHFLVNENSDLSFFFSCLN